MHKITITSIIKILTIIIIILMITLPYISRKRDLKMRHEFLNKVEKLISLSSYNSYKISCKGKDKSYNDINIGYDDLYYRIEYDENAKIKYFEATDNKYSISIYDSNLNDLFSKIDLYPNNYLYCDNIYSFKVKGNHAKVVVVDKQVNKNDTAYAYVQPFYGYTVINYKCDGNYLNADYSNNVLSIYNVNSPVYCEFSFKKEK